MIGALVGAGLSLAGTLWGGSQASKAAKKQKADLEAQRAENREWYDRRYNEDATQRADAQRVLTQAEETIRERNRAAAGRQAVAGGTEESVAATKEANAQGLASAASAIAANGEARKDRIEESYRGRDSDLRSSLGQMEMQRAQNTAQAVRGVGSAASNMFSLLDSEGMLGSRRGGGDDGVEGTLDRSPYEDPSDDWDSNPYDYDDPSDDLDGNPYEVKEEELV